jgi:hypothetical protein
MDLVGGRPAEVVVNCPRSAASFPPPWLIHRQRLAEQCRLLVHARYEDLQISS